MTHVPTECTSIGDVLHLLDLFEAEGIDCWIAGGWGVDALIGRESREHRDLDVLVSHHDVLEVHRVLLDDGYVMETNSFPTRFEMRNDLGSRVDVHPIRIEADGTARLELPGGTWWDYPAEALAARGTIGERAVACVSVSQQFRNHTGYTPAAKEAADIAALARAFPLELGVDDAQVPASSPEDSLDG